METNVRLYALNYDEAKTYLWAMVFVACNLILPQVFHLIPQGGIIFSPLSLVILAGAYKFGWKTGLLAARIATGQSCHYWYAHLGSDACHDAETRCASSRCRTCCPALQDRQSAASHRCHPGQQGHRLSR